MNRVQQVVARLAGVDEYTNQQSDVLDQALVAMESMSENVAWLERQLEDLRYIDVYNANETAGDKGEIVSDEQRNRVLLRLRRLRHHNPIAKRSVNLTIYFVLGNEISYTIVDQQISDQFSEFWNDPENQAVLTHHDSMVMRYDEVLTDGEDFITMSAAQAAPYVKLGTVPMEQIKQILYHPQNDQVPVWYKRVWYPREFDQMANGGQGGWKPVDTNNPTVKYYRDWRITDEWLTEIEEQGLQIDPSRQMMDGNDKPIYMKHRFINPVRMRSGIRGLPLLFSSREWVGGYKNFQEDRLSMNAAAAAIAIHRKVQGGPAKVKALAQTFGGIPTKADGSGSDSILGLRQRPTAAILTTTAGEDLKGVRIDTGAAQAQLDAAALMSAIGAGVDHPAHYIVGSSNNALAGVQSIEIATMKGYEAAQTWVKNDLLGISQFVFRQILGENTDVPQDEQTIAWDLPQIDGKDVVKYITAFAQFTQQIAPKNREAQLVAIKGGLVALRVPNVEQAMKKIEEDQKRVNTAADQATALQAQAVANGQVVPGGPPGPPNGNGNGNGNGKGGPNGGQQATDGTHVLAQNPATTRGQKLKPPPEATTGPRTSRQ